MSSKLVNMIFGMKLRQARTEADLTLTEFASMCELSPSYLTEIEKGRKYPRADKIMRMAEVLGKSYDDLVSIQLDPSLSYLQTTLSSAIFQRFPFEEFGMEAGDLVTLLTREPEKVSALLHAVLAIGRRYDLQEEEFLRASLRAYQEIHENYFHDLEEAAQAFTEEIGNQWGMTDEPPLRNEVLETILQEHYRYLIDMEAIADNPELKRYRSIYIAEKNQPTLFVNPALHERQVRFVLARELGYQYLGLKERSFASTPNRIDSFQQIVNDFKAAYFGGTLLMPRKAMLADLQHLFSQTTWQPQLLLDMLHKYEVTPEMLFYRFSELIPQFFGIRLHFLRFHNSNGRYDLIKQLNMNQLIVPSGIGLHEHHCRRWLSVRLLQEEPQDEQDYSFDLPLVGAQYSEFIESRDQFLCLGFARPMVLSPQVESSVIVGFRVDGDMKNLIRFVDDPVIPRVFIHETCERCPLTAAQCQERAAPPTILEVEAETTARRLALERLREKMRKP